MPWKQVYLLSPLFSLLPSVHRLDFTTSHSIEEHRCQSMPHIDILMPHDPRQTLDSQTQTQLRRCPQSQLMLCLTLNQLLMTSRRAENIQICLYLFENKGKRGERADSTDKEWGKLTPEELITVCQFHLISEIKFLQLELVINCGKQHRLWSVVETVL